MQDTILGQKEEPPPYFIIPPNLHCGKGLRLRINESCFMFWQIPVVLRSIFRVDDV